MASPIVSQLSLGLLRRRGLPEPDEPGRGGRLFTDVCKALFYPYDAPEKFWAYPCAHSVRAEVSVYGCEIFTKKNACAQAELAARRARLGAQRHTRAQNVQALRHESPTAPVTGADAITKELSAAAQA